MSDHQLQAALIVAGTLLALFLVIVLFAWLGFLPVQPATNYQLPTR